MKVKVEKKHIEKITHISIYIVLFLIHISLLHYNISLKLVFSGDPLTSFDYDTHFEQTKRVVEALQGWGKSWAWDPHLLAGFPNGTIFDADNKAHELFCYLLSTILHIPLPVAFNLFIWLGHLLCPAVAWFTAKMLKMKKSSTAVAVFLSIMVWNFDSMTRWVWWVGMISYAIASFAAPAGVATLYRAVESGSVVYAAVLIFLLPAVHLIHPYSFLMLFVPMGLIYLTSVKKLPVKINSLVIASGVSTIVANLYWLIVAFKFFPYITESKIYGLAEFWFIFTDFLGLIANTENQALVGMRSGWRFLIWILAAGWFILHFKDRRDKLYTGLAAGLAVLLLISYFGKYLPVTSHIQPYRHVVPLTFMAIFPASMFLIEAIEQTSWSKIKLPLRIVFATIVLVASAHLIRDIIYFIPSLKPRIDRPEVGLPNISDTLGFGSLGWPDQQEYRHGIPKSDYRQLRNWVISHDDRSGRFLIQWWVLGEYLAWSTDAQIMGGFRHINLKHGFSNIFRLYYHKPPPEKFFRKYIKTYAIKYLIVSGHRHPIEYHSHLLKGYDFIPPFHRIYILDQHPSWFMKGDGKLTASLNKIEVRNSTPGEIILKYHFLDTFICKPDCRVEEFPVEIAPVGFIRVTNHPPEFVIENGY